MKASTRLMQTPDLGLPPTRTVTPELYRGSTVYFDSYADLLSAGRGEYPGVTYGTDRLPQQRILEQAIGELEGAALTRVFRHIHWRFHERPTPAKLSGLHRLRLAGR